MDAARIRQQNLDKWVHLKAITIDPIIIEKLVAEDPPARHWVIYNKEKLQQKLEAELLVDYPTRSMQAVAKELGCQPLALTRCFPDLCQAIRDRHRTYQRKTERT